MAQRGHGEQDPAQTPEKLRRLFSGERTPPHHLIRCPQRPCKPAAPCTPPTPDLQLPGPNGTRSQGHLEAEPPARDLCPDGEAEEGCPVVCLTNSLSVPNFVPTSWGEPSPAPTRPLIPQTRGQPHRLPSPGWIRLAEATASQDCPTRLQQLIRSRLRACKGPASSSKIRAHSLIQNICCVFPRAAGPVLTCYRGLIEFLRHSFSVPALSRPVGPREGGEVPGRLAVMITDQ